MKTFDDMALGALNDVDGAAGGPHHAMPVLRAPVRVNRDRRGLLRPARAWRQTPSDV